MLISHIPMIKSYFHNLKSSDIIDIPSKITAVEMIAEINIK